MMNPKQKKAKKAQLVKLFGLRCFWCGCDFPEKELTLDHLMPQSKGGSDNQENLRLACRSCNQARGNSLFPPKHCVYGK